MSNTTLASYAAIGVGLDTWNLWARAIRVMTRNGGSFPVGSGGNIVNTGGLQKYYLGAAVIVAVLFISLLASLTGSLGQCCSLCCCIKKIRAKRRAVARSTPGKRGCAIVWILLIFVAFFLGSITSFLGTSILSTAFVNLKKGALGTLNGTSSTLLSLSPGISTAFLSIELLVNVSVDSTVNAINFDSLVDTGVTPKLQILGDGFTAANVSEDALIALGKTISSQKVALASSIASLAIILGYITGNITSWSSTQLAIPSSGTTYQLTTAVSYTGISATAAQTSLSASPDGSTSMSPLTGSPNLKDFGIEIYKLINTLRVTLKTTVKDSTVPALKNGSSSATSALDSASAPLITIINNAYTTTNNGLGTVISYDTYRIYAVSALSGLIIAVLVVLSVSMIAAKPSAVKGCNLCASPIYILIQLLAILLFIFALLIGDVCTTVFETTPSPLIVSLGDTGKLVGQVFSLRDQCYSGNSILTIITNLGFVNSSQTNLTTIANDQMSTINFSSIATGFDLTGSLDLSASPAAELSVLLNLNVSSLVVTALVTLNNTDLANLNTQLLSLSATLSGLQTSITQASLTFTPINPTNTEAANAVIDIKSRIGTVIGLISALTGTSGSIYSIQVSVGSMAGNISKLHDDTITLQDSMIPMPGIYNQSIVGLGWFSGNSSKNLTLVTPQVQDNIRTSILKISSELLNSTRCDALGAGLLNIQYAVCGNLLNSLDSMWLSYALIAIFAALSMPALIWAANVIWAHTYSKVMPDGSGNGRGGYKVMNSYEDENEGYGRQRNGEIVVTIR